MNRLCRSTAGESGAKGRLLLGPMVAGLLAFLPTTGLGQDLESSSPNLLEWRHAWSLPKWLILAVLVAVLWDASFRFIFKRSIDPQRERAPRPRDAFARTMAFFYAASVLAFIACFTALGYPGPLWDGPKLTLFPEPFVFLNTAWLMALSFLAMIVGYFAVLNLLRGVRQSRD